MFDLGWGELLIVGVVALIVVGPKDLPGMFRTLGRFVGKMRGMAREFQRAMDSAADEAGVADVAKDLKSVASPKSLGLDVVNDMADRVSESWKSPRPSTGFHAPGSKASTSSASGNAQHATAETSASGTRQVEEASTVASTSVDDVEHDAASSSDSNNKSGAASSS